MIISEIEYHLVLIPVISEHMTSAVKSDLAIILPDILLEYKGTMKKLSVSPENLLLGFSVAPEFSPAEIADGIAKGASIRLKRRYESLKGYGLVFMEHYYLKSGKAPTRAQINDFISIATRGI